ncbi:unnamed protein product [Brassica rapa]|uniref:Uncharacterized protein n=1 Tax=Brassica campestris TaxID=3711 RepID=A0A8D9GX78_BRACM|nr:unnamed protein product [Brassica rapa]
MVHQLSKISTRTVHGRASMLICMYTDQYTDQSTGRASMLICVVSMLI